LQCRFEEFRIAQPVRPHENAPLITEKSSHRNRRTKRPAAVTQSRHKMQHLSARVVVLGPSRHPESEKHADSWSVHGFDDALVRRRDLMSDREAEAVATRLPVTG